MTFLNNRKLNIRFSANDLGIDLGTSNVLIYSHKQGIVTRAPSVIALDKNTGGILEVGAAAQNMLGRTPGNVIAAKPLRGGVICDHEMTVKLLQELFRDAINSSFFKPKPRVVISVPCGITEVEERTVINAAVEAGARRVYLIEEPLAAALGAGLDIKGPNGHMVVDIGSGTSDIAVISMNDVAISSSLKIAGDAFDEAIVRRVRSKYSLNIGMRTAEEIKIQIGCVMQRPENISMIVKGRDVATGRPREETVSSVDIFEPLFKLASQIADEVQNVLDRTTPELVDDIDNNGITLTGGASQIWGMADLLEARTGIRCSIADDPHSCVAYGCGKSLDWINNMQDGARNFARKRLMQEY